MFFSISDTGDSQEKIHVLIITLDWQLLQHQKKLQINMLRNYITKTRNIYDYICILKLFTRIYKEIFLLFSVDKQLIAQIF